MKELLDSDRLNYLVWRYLLEGNYRETAAKFQKEWRVEAPHRHFDFANHVKNYALVSILNKGLIYQSLERDYALQRVQGDAAATADEHQQFGVFGPLVPQPPVNYEELEDEDEDRQRLPTSEPGLNDADKSLKRQAEPQAQLPNGNTAKRPRLGNVNSTASANASANANGLENGNGADPATSPMEIDQHQSDNHAYPSPLEGEQAPTPAPRTEGPDHGTQTDKVEDLEAKTVYLRLAPDDASSVAATPTAEVSHSRTNQNPILLHCEWNPKDPSRLAAAGTDALARVWTVSRATGPEQLADHVGPDWPSINLVADGFPPHSRVTAMAWGSDGKEIAVATDDGQKARIDLWNLDGKQLHTYTGLEAPIVKLRCHPVTRHILCITPILNPSGYPRGWTVTVFPSPTSSPVAYEYNIPPDQDIEVHQPDAVWVEGQFFVLSVGTRVLRLQCSAESITEVKELPTRADDSLTQIQYAALADGTGYFAAATLKGEIDIWDPRGQRQTISGAHDGQIISLQFQPSQARESEGELLLASGGEDGTIAIWDARSPDKKPRLQRTIDDNPVVALSFAPDGAFIAGASRDQVLIFKVGEYSSPRSAWKRTAQPGALSPKINGLNGEPEVEDQHSLSWDANGQRLAFGVNGLLAVINFR
ncbi:F-box-like/WD repeat-containing protein TBL1XR1 [Cytospora mali]|uniref:F-box-like/WD repeat-containing protein TBL1XR1 n=1 Tax=Cytospora mali TaxID=578113 RepID=A0A194WC48_CYTMA|nr:F-box-like/WD repeat-containing protein TBL1XR1 [Valsa mali]